MDQITVCNVKGIICSSKPSKIYHTLFSSHSFGDRPQFLGFTSVSMFISFTFLGVAGSCFQQKKSYDKAIVHYLLSSKQQAVNKQLVNIVENLAAKEPDTFRLGGWKRVVSSRFVNRQLFANIFTTYLFKTLDTANM